MAELYERVLAHVPTPQLHKSYNGILVEEFAAVAQTLSDVLAAFAKLEEVHDAVSKLQQSHDSSAGGRSDSVVASAYNAVKLEQQLQHEVEKLAAGMKVAQLERKRKRVEEKAATVPSALDPARESGADEKRASCNSAVKRTKMVQARAGSDSASESSEEQEESKLSAQVRVSKEGDDSLIMKRKAAVSSGFKSESDGSDENGDDEDADGVEGSDVAWRALVAKSDEPSSEVEPEPSPAKKQADADTKVAVKRSSRTVWYVKVIVDEVKKLSRVDRSFIVPDLLAALKESVEEDVNGLYSAGVMSSMVVLVGWWTHGSEYEAQHVELYREYVAVVQSYYNQLSCSRQKRGHKRLIETLCLKIKNAADLVLPAKAKEKAVAAIEAAKKKGAFSSMMGGPDTLPPEKQTKRLLCVLLAFRKETGRDVDNAFSTRMIKAIGRLIRWLGYDLGNARQFPAYRMIVNAMRAFAEERIPDRSTKDRIIGLLQSMSEAILDPSNSKNDKKLIKLGKDATQVFGEVKKWRGRRITPREAFKLKEAVEALVEDMTIGWHPCQDITMRKCVKELKSILVQAQAQTSDDAKSKRGFEVCLSVVLRWKVEDPPVVHVVRAPTE